MLYEQHHRNYLPPSKEHRYVWLLWEQAHEGWLTCLSGTMVLVEEISNTPDLSPFSHTGLGKMISLQRKRKILPSVILLEVSVLKTRPHDPFLILLSSLSHCLPPAFSLVSDNQSLPTLVNCSSFLVSETGQWMEKKMMHRELLLAVFSVLMLLLGPSEWLTASDNWS